MKDYSRWQLDREKVYEITGIELAIPFYEYLTLAEMIGDSLEEIDSFIKEQIDIHGKNYMDMIVLFFSIVLKVRDWDETDQEDEHYIFYASKIKEVFLCYEDTFDEDAVKFLENAIHKWNDYVEQD